VTTTNCGLPAGQYDVALVDWRGRSIKALDATLDWLLDFLSSAGGLVVWIDPQEPAGNRKLRSLLEKHGLVVEVGTVREHGCVVSAQRSDMKATSKVA
jgi:ribulose-5-phosphate 4-epimerase/fuculose-1-phosphate aldolase